MGWYYDSDSIDNYHNWRRSERLLEKARKVKRKLEEKRRKERQKALEKIEKARKKEFDILERKRLRKEAIAQKKKELKENGWKSGYVRQNVLVRNNKARNLEICKEIYFKAKGGMTTRELAIEYNRPYAYILRHKYEYETYLNALANKGDENEN
jgi:hypothetical protein